MSESPRVLALVAVFLCFAVSPAFADRMALWTIVHGQCEPHQAAGDPPAPCDSLDIESGEDRGFALLKDLRGVAQMLAIPTRRVTGIEDPFLLAPDAPNYFADAWTGRAQLEAHLGRPVPREAVGLSINSMYSRSQDQLHIHIDCMRPDVVTALTAQAGAFDTTWRRMAVELGGREYWARRVDSSDLSGASPFQLLAEGISGASADMGSWTIIAVPANFQGKPVFVLLADRVGLAAGGHAEDLQDHDCAIVPPKA